MPGKLALSVVAAAVLLHGGAAGQQSATYTFRLVANPSNLGTCKGLDASMSREHTLTVTGNQAVIKSNGGIDDNLKPAGPGTWRTDFSLARVRLVVVADVSKSPRTLVVTEPREGCRWSGQAP